MEKNKKLERIMGNNDIWETGNVEDHYVLRCPCGMGNAQVIELARAIHVQGKLIITYQGQYHSQITLRLNTTCQRKSGPGPIARQKDVSGSRH